MPGAAGACRRRAARAVPAGRRVLAAFLSLLLPALLWGVPAVQAATHQEFRVSLTILPSEDVRRLPAVVQRLDQFQPGYGDRWAHARRMAATDPLQAVRSLRQVHASMLEQPEAGAWEGDMAAAGQALFHRDGDAPVMLSARAGG